MTTTTPRRRKARLTVENIATDLHPLAVPIEWISPLPGNPRRGKVEAIAKSYARFGQRKPIVVNKTGEVDGHPIGVSEAGNHQMLAAQSMDWEYIAVVWVDDDDATAKAFSLADNQLHDIGEYDTPLLAEFVADVATTSDGIAMLADAGFGADQLSSLIRSTQTPASTSTGGEAPEPTPGIGLGTPVISTTIVFETGEQQQAWYGLIRWLRTNYPDAETTGERIALYVNDYVDLDS